MGTARVDLAWVDGLGDIEAGRQVLLGDLAKRFDQAAEPAHRAAADEGPAARRTEVGVAFDHVDPAGVDAQLAGRQQAVGLRMPLARLRAGGVDLDPALLRHPDPGAVIARDGGDAALAVLGRAGATVLV